MYTNTHSHTLTNLHTYTLALKYTYTHILPYTHTHARMPYVLKLSHTNSHTHPHTHIHTLTYIAYLHSHILTPTHIVEVGGRSREVFYLLQVTQHSWDRHGTISQGDHLHSGNHAASLWTSRTTSSTSVSGCVNNDPCLLPASEPMPEPIIN